jgi:hypothetical protein
MAFCFVAKDYVYKTQAELSVFDEGEQQDLLNAAAGGGKRTVASTLCSVYLTTLHLCHR